MKLKYDDDNHAYWLAVDGGKLIRCKGVTGVAGIPDDGYGLEQWRKRKIVEGMVVDPTLLAEARKNPDDRDHIQAIGERALNAARVHDKAERGTQLHRILERHDLGEIAEVETMVTDIEARAARAGWTKALTEAKITLDDDLVERILVFPQQRIAGRMDRFVQVGRSKSRTVLDLKTGKIDYPHKIAIQLGMYAHASQMAGVLDDDGITESFSDLPDMDTKWGLIAHMPTPGEIDIVKVDIAAGWKAAQEICFKTIEWRANKSLVKPFVSVELADPNEPANDEHIATIKARIAAIKDAGELAQRLCRARWPKNVAMPKQSSEWTIADVEKIEARLETVERDGEVPF